MSERSFDGPGLYLHVPFCSAICPYCDFAVRKDDRALHEHYVRALIREIEQAARTEENSNSNEPYDTIYFGGGTPSVLASTQLAEIVDACHRVLSTRPDAWIFLEANPEDVSLETLQAWRQVGVRTLSLGVQSFDDAELKFLGRRHSAEQSRRSVELALEAGFETLSVDLIYGLPNQEPETLAASLATAIGLGPHHLSCYQLTFHDGTPFGRALATGRLAELPDPRQAAAFRQVHGSLAEAGFPAYEVSNFARNPAFQSRHNRKYWNHTRYLGFGPSAHSFDGERRRWWNLPALDDWVATIDRGKRPLAGDEDLSDSDLALETLMLGLRTVVGVDLAEFERRFSLDLLAINRALIERLIEEGWLREDSLPERLALSETGLVQADGVAARFEV